MKSYVVALCAIFLWHGNNIAGCWSCFDILKGRRNQETHAEDVTPAEFTDINGYMIQTNCKKGKDAMRNYTVLMLAIENQEGYDTQDAHNLRSTILDQMRILLELNNAEKLDDSQISLQKKLIQTASKKTPVDLRHVTSEEDATHE